MDSLSDVDLPLRPLWTSFSYFPHQLSGIHWMLHHERFGSLIDDDSSIYGGFQCDDMGLGKTIQITSVIINNPHKFTLLIAPLAMLQTWSDVLVRSGCLVYHTINGEWVLFNDSSLPFPRYFAKMRPAVYLSNYEKLYTSPSLFRQQPWARVVLDEAHKIRNPDGLVAFYARRIIAPIRWVVTGTPLVNSLKDIVSLLAFLHVPTSPLFRWEPRFLRLLPSLLLHRSLHSLRSVIPNAPPLPIFHTLTLPFTTNDEQDFYFGVQGALNNSLFANELLSSSQAFVLLLRLRQISVHPQIYINAKRRQSASYSRPDWSGPSTKLLAIRDIILNDSSTESVHKYLIFCQFNDEMTLIRDFLSSFLPLDLILLYNGSMTPSQRSDVLSFSKNSTQPTVLLMQLQAGGVGLNLQEYDRIIFVSPWWTSALIDQAVARAVRIGQNSVVHVYHLRLASDAESSLNIDSLVSSKADQKRIMLDKLFALCEPSDSDKN